MTSPIAIRLKDIGKSYRIYARPEDRLKQMLFRGFKTYFSEFHALSGVNLTVRKGETVGLVGCNGSGKSTLLQIACGTLSPSHGEREVTGRISALLELGAGFNPEFSGKENIYLNAAILGLSKAETDARYGEIVAFSGLDHLHISQPVKTYSSGMYVRLAFAVAVAVEPDILVVDEALAVGDEGFQRKCYARIRDMQTRGATILFVSHAAQTIVELCDRAIFMDQGEIVEEGAPKAIIADYHRLIFAPLSQRRKVREAIKSGAEDVETAISDETVEEATGLSESRIEYEKHGGEITDIKLTDEAGVPVGALETGGRYCLHYQVKYDEDAELPCYGMLIKTKRGIELGGAVAREMMRAQKTVSAGQVMKVKFTFDCPLRPGHYFINCGSTKREEDRDIFVHRIVDAWQFKVIDHRLYGTLEAAGLLDLNINATLNETDSRP